MNIQYKYFFLQLKRHIIKYPLILFVSLCTVGVALLLGYSALSDFSAENVKRINVGIVGDEESPYLKVGIEALKTVDTSRFAVNFEEMEEKEAKAKLSRNELSGYVFVPESVIKNESIVKSGAVTYYMPRISPNFGTVITSEIAESASDIVSESRAAIYAMQNLAGKHKNEISIKEKTNALDMKYINTALGRSKLFEVHTLGLADGIGYVGYWFCAFLIMSVMLWGISCSSVLCGNGGACSMLLKIRGLSGFWQIMCEYISYLIITVITFVPFVLLLGMVLKSQSFNGEAVRGMIDNFSEVIFSLLPVIAMMCAMHIASYEIIGNAVGTILFIFMLTLGGGYLSGFFYPVGFFPGSIRQIGSVLPTGAGFGYMRKVLSGQTSMNLLFACLLYSAVFLAVSVWARKYKMNGGDIC